MKKNAAIYCRVSTEDQAREGYSLPEQSIIDLNDLLLNNKNIEKIIMSINRDNENKGIINICPGIKHNLKITHLILPMCCMNDEGAEMLANSLFNNINIKEINLEDNKIGLSGIKELSEKVFGKISLNKINLSHNLIDEEGAKYLVKSLGSSEVAPIAADAADETAKPVPKQANPMASPIAK